MKILFLSLLLTSSVLADKDVSGLRSASFSANSNPYQIDQSDQGQANTRIVHSATPQSFGQDVQGKQFGQNGNSFGFTSSGASADSSSAYQTYQPQKPVYPDSGYSTNNAASYAPPPSVGGYPASVGSSYIPTPTVGGYPASVGGYPASQVSIQNPKPQYGQPASTGESYAYHYQHYPQQTHHHHSDYGTESHSSSLFDSDLFSGFGSFGDGEGLAGLGGLGGGGSGGIAAAAGIKALKALKGISIAAKIAKHFLVVKPFIMLGLLFLIALPFIILFFPIPIISIANPPSRSSDGSARGSPQDALITYLSDLTGKVLNAEECVERILCKMPEFPDKYRGKAKGLWEEFGSKYVTNSRVTRGMTAYFEDQEPSKNKAFKCDQKFKCSNKLFSN